MDRLAYFGPEGHQMDAQNSDESLLSPKTEQQMVFECFDGAPVCLFCLDGEGKIIRINRAGSKLLRGDTVQDVLNRYISDFCTEKSALVKLQGHWMKAKPVQNLELSLQTLDGKTKTVLFSSNPLKLEGRPPLIQCTLIDVSRSKRGAPTIEMEEDLRSQLRLAAAVESSSDAVIGVRMDGTISSWKGAAHRVYGYTTEEIVGRPLAVIFQKQCAQEVDILFNQIEAGSKTENGQSIHRRKSGEDVHVKFNVTPIFDRDGAVSGALIVSCDVSERKKAEQSRLRMAVIVESSDDAIWSESLQGKILTWNRGAEQIYGYTAEEAIGRSVSMLVPPSRYQDLWDILESIRKGQKVEHYETIGVMKNGKEIEISLTASPIKDAAGTIIGAAKIVRDVTERRMAEEMRRRKEAAEAANQAKSDFLAQMSHEIRTPLNSILGISDVLWDTPLNHEQREYVRVARKAGENLLNLIDSVLDLSKLDAGNLQLRPLEFDLIDLVESTAEMFAVAAHGKGLELICKVDSQVPQKVLGDPNRLRQVLSNLLANAIKFTDHGSVAITVTDNLRPGYYLFTVSDTGIGIQPDKQSVIFDKFVQGNIAVAAKYGGSGLGLAICKQIVQLMEGTLGVNSEPGQGSIFYFTAKLEAVKVKTSLTDAVPQNPGIKKVLVADGNGNSLEHLRDLLSELGLEVSIAMNGEDVLQLYRRSVKDGAPYSVLLLDHRLPEIDGFEVARQLGKDDDKMPEIVILLTADARLDQIATSKQLKNIRYLNKPIKRADLVKRVFESSDGEHETGAAGSKALPAPGKTLEILLADDNEDNRAIIKAFLKHLACNIDIAENGARAVELFKGKRYDLVLMDIQMPIVDGYTATQTIRAHERNSRLPRTPILALSAYAHKQETDRMIKSGCTQHLAKPIKKAALLKTILELCPGVGAKITNRDLVFDGDEALKPLVPSYLLGLQHQLMTMQKALERGEFEMLKRFAHDIKGTGESYGFKKISEAALCLEEASIQRDRQNASYFLDQVTEYVRRAQDCFA